VRVRIGASDPSLTGCAGLVAVSELVDLLGVVQALDDGVAAAGDQAGLGPFKQRARGLTAGEFLVAVACCQATGGDFLVALDRCRADAVGQLLGPVASPASTTAATLAKRLTAGRRAGIEAGIAAVTARMLTRVPAARRRVLTGGPATVDIDATEVEVYGRAKAGVEYNYLGQRAGRPHLATWAEAGVVLAADLLSGRQDPRNGALDLITRAVAGLPADVAAAGRPRVRADIGYFTAAIATGAVAAGCDFAIGVPRNPAVWRALTGIKEDAWTAATAMPGAQVAVGHYLPAGWPPGSRLLVRRVRHDAAAIGADPRARRRRTIPADQLALALDGQADQVHAYSFIITNLPVDTPDQAAAAEHWHRSRTDIEDRIRDAKHGAALRHLPSGDPDVNTTWMWGALLAVNLGAWLHELALAPITGGQEQADGRGRAHLPRLRRELICLPGRLIRHGRRTTLRLPPDSDHDLKAALTRLRPRPAPA
jgi:hypothetical protein